MKLFSITKRVIVAVVVAFTVALTSTVHADVEIVDGTGIIKKDYFCKVCFDQKNCESLYAPDFAGVQRMVAVTVESQMEKTRMKRIDIDCSFPEYTDATGSGYTATVVLKK